MHKPKRKSKYWEQFSYEYNGVTYTSKKKCCDSLGLRYLGVLQHAHDYNCTFEEAISQMLSNKQKKEFVFRNRKWLNLENCCDFYKISRKSVQALQYQCGYTVQEALERSIAHANKLRFKYKGKYYASFRDCCKEMGIPESTVRRCMNETGKSKAVALNYCLKKAENRTEYNPSPFIYKGKEYSSFIKCCADYNIEADKIRQKSIAGNISLPEALDYYLVQHPIRRKQNYDDNLSHVSLAEQCRQYGIKRYEIYNYIKKHNCSTEEAFEHYLELKRKIGTGVIEFEGVKYADLHECCQILNVPYRRAYTMILSTECSVQEALQTLIQEKEKLFGSENIVPITLENGKHYENIKELCSNLHIKSENLYGYAYRHGCSIREAADYYEKRQEASQNVQLKVGNQIYTDLRKCCEEQGIPYKWVYRRMVNETVSAEESVEHFLKRKEMKQKRAQQKNQTTSTSNSKPCVPQKVVVMGKEYPSKTSCYDDLKIQKKLVQKRMKDTNCSFEEAVIAVYQARVQKEFHFHGKVYRSFNACCREYGLAQEYIAIKAKREGITRQEAIEKILALREKSTL